MVEILVTVVSIGASLVTIYVFVEKYRQRTSLTWRQMEKGLRRILADISRDGFSPDMIVGVGRGGGILASILAGNLGHKPFIVLDTEISREQGVGHVEIREHFECPDLGRARVLVAVAELYSGYDLRAGLDYLKKASGELLEVRTVALVMNVTSIIEPDYVAIRTKYPLAAPWRLTSHYKSRRL